MLVLGKVIEVASGQDYFDYVREHVYKPAGMTNTDAYELDRVNHTLAVGYEPEGTATGVEYRNNSSCTSSAAGRRAAATPPSTT
jgi:CubicO group peptidase (beta-lactamase class C family)